MGDRLKYALLFIGFTIIGYQIRNCFLELTFSQLDSIEFNMHNRFSGKFKNDLLFYLIVGGIPLLYSIAEKYAGMRFLYKGFVSYLIIIVSGILAWQFRVYQIRIHYETIAITNFGDLKLGLYVFLGFLVGTILSIVIYRKIERKIEN